MASTRTSTDHTRRRRWTRAAMLLLSLFVAAVATEAQMTPSTTVLTSRAVANINGNAGHVAANSAGDAFFVSQTDQVAYWVKRGTTTPIPLVSGLSGGRSVFVDRSNNVFVPSNYSGVVIEVPYVNGTYTANSVRTSLSACTSNTPTTPCLQLGNGGAGVSYYYQATDLGIDGSGNVYVADAYDSKNNGGGKFNSIDVFTYNGVSYVASVLIDNLPETQNAQIAVDSKGDIYYADGTNLLVVPKGATAPTPFGTGFSNPTGVAVDAYGNLYVTDSKLSQIIEFPAVNGVAQTNRQFVFDPTYSANGVAFDGLGDMYYTAYGSQTNLSVTRINSFNLGSATKGTVVGPNPVTLTLNFIAPQTLGALTLNGAGAGFSYTAGTCATGTSYAAAGSCTFAVNFTPAAAGLERGAIVITNSAGAVIGTAELLGTGLGAEQTSDPGATSPLGSGYTAPTAVAVDGANNVFIADAGKNAVYEYATGSSTAVSVASGLSKPSSVAVDNAGNLFIGDAGNGRVVEVPFVSGSLSTSGQTAIVSGLGTMLGLATDPYGSLYIADTNNNKVLMLGTINGVASSSAMSTVALPSSSVAPYALATDNVGDLFIADATANTVTEISYYGRATTNIGNGYSHPSGLAVDASGSLYIADPGNIRLIKVPYEAPIYNTNDQYSVGQPFTVASGVAVPYGVALDSAANLYVVDNQNATVTFLNRTHGLLNLGNSNVNSTTAQQNAYIADAGNQPLQFGNPAYLTTPNPAFSLTSPSSGGCVSSGTLQPGFACQLAATFTPPAAASYTQQLNFNTNAANTATPSLTLSGTGLNVAATTLKLAQTAPSGNAAFGQTVTITATISSTTSGTPSGDVIFYVDGGFYSVVKVSGPTASVNINGLLGGSHTIAASYTGDNTFASSNSTLTITVVKAGSTITVTATGGSVFQNPASAAAGASVTLTAAVAPNASTVPTGTVTFSVNGTTLGTGTVATVSGKYQATISTSSLPAGSAGIIATYSGDINYTSSSGSLTFYTGPQTYAVSPASQTVTMGRAATATVPLQFTSLSGFGPAYVTLTCTGLPANTTCGFNPNGFPLQPSNQLTAAQTDITGTRILVPATFGPVNVNLILTTGTTPVIVPPVTTGQLHPFGSRGSAIQLALLALLPGAFFFRRRVAKRLGRAIHLLLMIGVLGLTVTTFSGCGSNLIGDTPAGSYTIKITATATDPNYPPVSSSAPYASGCVLTPATATFPTCTQTAQVTLVIK